MVPPGELASCSSAATSPPMIAGRLHVWIAGGGGWLTRWGLAAWYGAYAASLDRGLAITLTHNPVD